MKLVSRMSTQPVRPWTAIASRQALGVRRPPHAFKQDTTDTGLSELRQAQKFPDKNKFASKSSRTRNNHPYHPAWSRGTTNQSIGKTSHRAKNTIAKPPPARGPKRQKIAVVRRSGRMIIRIFTVKSDPADDLDKKALPETEMMRKMRAQLGKLSLANKRDQTSGRHDEVCHHLRHRGMLLPLARVLTMLSRVELSIREDEPGLVLELRRRCRSMGFGQAFWFRQRLLRHSWGSLWVTGTLQG
jgi:hypothetical protein